MHWPSVVTTGGGPLTAGSAFAMCQVLSTDGSFLLSEIWSCIGVHCLSARHSQRHPRSMSNYGDRLSSVADACPTHHAPSSTIECCMLPSPSHCSVASTQVMLVAPTCSCLTGPSDPSTVLVTTHDVILQFTVASMRAQLLSIGYINILGVSDIAAIEGMQQAHVLYHHQMMLLFACSATGNVSDTRSIHLKSGPATECCIMSITQTPLTML